jgi:hypothetical protein
MPMLNQAVTVINTKLGPTQIGQTAALGSPFAALPLPAGFVFANPPLRAALQTYLNSLPLGMQEMLRATLHHALTKQPPTPVVMLWEAAYGYEIKVTETPDAPHSRGMIGIVLRTRYADDLVPVVPSPIYSRPGSKSPSKRAAKGAPRPAKRRPSKRS